MATRGFKVIETIELPPNKVWSILTDWAHASAWMGPVEEIAPAGGGAVQEGTKLRFKARGGEHESTVIAFDPPNRIELTSTQSGITAAYDYRLREVDGRTEITLNATCTATGWIRLMHPLIAYMMKRVDSKQLAALKRIAESTA